MALRAHEETNCLTEVMIARAEGDLAEKKKEEDEDGDEGGDVNLKGPLAGIPISLKDTVVVGGFDVSVGYSAMTGRPAATDGSLVRILRDAGQSLPMIVWFELSCPKIVSRSYSLREDQFTNHASLLRVCQRCLGSHYEPAQ